MSRLLKWLLVWSGGAALLTFLVPSVIVVAALALIIPGLVLAAMPTVFLYTAIFSAAWFGLRRLNTFVAGAVGMAAVGAVAVLLPEAINTIAAARMEEAAARDREPPIPVGRADRIGLQVGGETWAPDRCNDLCLLLLLNGAADEIVVLARSDAPPPPRSRPEPRRPTTFRLIPAATCPGAEAIIGGGSSQSWTKQATEIAKAARLRMASGTCLSGSPAGETQPDLVIRRVVERIGTSPGRLALAPSAVEIDAVEIVAGGALLARASSRRSATLSVPLYLSPYGYGMSLDGWEWTRNGNRRDALDVVAALKRLTSFDLEVPRAPDAAELRARLDAALDNPALPADHPAFQLIADYYDALRKEHLKPDDRERLIRLIADDRVSQFSFFPYEAIRTAEGPALKNAILDRLLRLQAHRADPTYRSLESFTRTLPDRSFREPDPRVDTLLAALPGRSSAPNLVYRLADQGPTVAGRLVAIMREGWTAAPSDTKRRRANSDAGASAALGALCQIAPNVTASLPELRALAAEGVVPPATLEDDLWRVTLIRLGADASEFDKPKGRGGTVEQYRDRIQRRGCRT